MASNSVGVTNVITVNTPGPIGPQGIQGPSFSSGSMSLTGSLSLSGSYVDFTDAASGVSGSFSGSFAGDGTNITGVTAEWDGTHVGDAQITGSLSLSGSLLPNGSEAHDLGSTAHPWKDLYVGPQSIKFVSGSAVTATISTTSDGDIDLGNSSLLLSGSQSITGSLTVSGSGTLTNIGTFSQTGTSHFTGSIIVTGTGSGHFSGSFEGNGAGLTNVFEGTSASSSISTRITANETITARTLVSGSSQIDEMVLKASGSFSGSFQGNGSGLTNIPASGVTGLALNKISSGSAHVTTFATGIIDASGSMKLTGSLDVSSNITGNILNVNTRVKAVGSALEFAGDSLDFVDGDSLNYLMRASASNAVSLYYSGNKKLETTSTGISVTGTGSGHFSGSFQGNGAGLTNVFEGTTASSSISTRITANETITARTLVSSSAQIATDISGAFAAASASLASTTVTNASNISTITSATSSYITTGSGAEQTIDGNLRIVGNIIAQTYVVSSSITEITTSFSSGSHRFGDSIDDTQEFTGSLSVSGSITGFPGVTNDLTASFAVSASHVGNSLYVHEQSSPSATWTISHGLGRKYLAISVYDSADKYILPQDITATSTSATTLTFSSPQTGNAVVTIGAGAQGPIGATGASGSIPTGTVSSSAQLASDISGSLGSNATLIRSLTAAGISGSFTSTSASIASNIATNLTNISTNTSNITSLTGVTGSYATTGSNHFNGNQTISGSTEITGSLITRNSDVQFLGDGTYSNVIGDDATSAGNYSVAIGTNASSSGGYSVAIGLQAETENTAEISIGYQAGLNLGANTSTYNVYIGAEAGEESDYAANTVLIGRQAGKSNTKINSTVAIGAYALAATAAAWTGSNSTVVGYAAGYDTHGDFLNLFGEQAGAYGGYGQSLANRKHSEVVAIGDYSLYLTGIGLRGVVAVGTAAGQGVNANRRPSGSYSTNVGYYSGLGAQNASGVAIGQRAGYFSDSSGSVLVGAFAGEVSKGDYNIMLGYGAGQGVIGDNNIFIGENVASGSGALSNQLRIGSGSSILISGSLDTGDILLQGDVSSSGISTASFGTYIGDGSQLSGISTTPFPFVGDAVITGSLTVSGSNGFRMDSSNIVLGVNAGGGSVDTGTDDNNVIIGADAAGGGNLNSGDSSVLIGHEAGYNMTVGDASVMIGNQAGKYVGAGNTNVFIGNLAGGGSGAYTPGGSNIAIGYYANAAQGASAGSNNVVIGVQAGQQKVGAGNVILGTQAMYNAATGGDSSVIIGYYAGWKSAGDENIFIGYETGKDATSGDNNILIGKGVEKSAITNSDELKIGNESVILISGSLAAGGGLKLLGEVSASSYIGDGSGLTNLPSSFTAAGISGSFTSTSSSLAERLTQGNENISTWTLGASGTDHYTFTGPGLTGAENDPAIYLVRGQKYRFYNNSGGHPFRIQSTANGSAGTAYNDGVTNNDAGNGTYLLFDVQFDAPTTLYYQCTSHNNMGGPIYIADIEGVAYSGSFEGDGSALTGIVSASYALTASHALNAGGTGGIFIATGSIQSTTNDLQVTGSLTVAGEIAGTTKSFLIDHPTKPGYKLQYGVLEGPEHAVYVRGQITNENIIELPEEWVGLIHEDSITVQLTPIGSACTHYVKHISDNKVHIACECAEVNCFFFIQGERKDVGKLKTELE